MKRCTAYFINALYYLNNFILNIKDDFRFLLVQKEAGCGAEPHYSRREPRSSEISRHF